MFLSLCLTFYAIGCSREEQGTIRLYREQTWMLGCGLAGGMLSLLLVIIMFMERDPW